MNGESRRSLPHGILISFPAVARLGSDQIASVARATPISLLGYIVNASIALVVIGRVGSPFFAQAWAILAYAIAGFVLYRSFRSRPTGLVSFISRGLRRATLFGAFLGLPWGILAFAYLGELGGNGEILLIALTIGMAAAGSILLAPVYPAALMFMAVILLPALVKCIGQVVRATGSTSADFLLLALLIVGFAAFLVTVVGVAAGLSVERSEAQLRQQHAEARLRLLSELTGDGVLVHRDGVIVDMSGSVSRILKAPRGALVGRPLADVLGADFRLCENPGAAHTLTRTGGSGDRRVIEAEPRRVRLGSDSFDIVVVRDVTERDTALLEKRKAEAANEAKSRFLAVMSHEVRTPLSGVIGLTEILANSGLTDRQFDLVTSLQRSAGSLLTIINDILDISRVEAGQLAIERVPFDLAGCLDDVMALLLEEAARKSLVVNVIGQHSLPQRVIGDPARVRQVCLNLLSNAIKFTARGHVDFVVHCEHLSKDLVSVQFEIHDTGIGIAPEAIGTLFEPFKQADNSINRRYGGTGLGLSISRHLVHMMGGQISISSRPGEGTIARFSLKFPVARAEAMTTAAMEPDRADRIVGTFSGGVRQQPAKPSNRRFRAHVLVAEDNPVNVEVVRGYLESFGCSFNVVPNGALALRALQHSRYDICLMDYHMPELDGIAATVRFREQEACGVGRRLPIIAVTANAYPNDRDDCLAAGMDDFLSKPFTQEQLADMLEKWLPRAAVLREAKGQSKLDDGSPPMPGQRWQVTDVFIRHTPDLLMSLVTARNARDGKAARLAVHSLKSSATIIGEDRLADLCRSVELRIAEEGIAPCTDDIDQVVAECKIVLNRLGDGQAFGAEVEAQVA